MTTPDAEWISLGAALDLVVCFETDKRGHETATAEILRASQTHVLLVLMGRSIEAIAGSWRREARGEFTNYETLSRSDFPLPADFWRKEYVNGAKDWWSDDETEDYLAWDWPNSVFKRRYRGNEPVYGHPVTFHEEALAVRVRKDVFCSALEINSTRLLSASETGAHKPEIATKPKRGRPVGSGAIDDGAVFKLMHEKLTSGAATSVYAAAKLVAKFAGGIGTPESKVERLRKNYKQYKPST